MSAFRRRMMRVLGLCGIGLAGCPGPLPVTADAPPSGSPAPPGVSGPPQLVCYTSQGQLVVATAEGQSPTPLRLQPPQELVALAAASGTLVGASSGQLWALVPGDGGKRWLSVAHWDPVKWSAEPLRAASYGPSAVVWMRGKDPGTIPAALEVTAQGQVIKEAVSMAEQSLGGIWQSSHAPSGPYDRTFPETLRLLVAQVRMSGQLAREELLHSERTPWGGRLVAPNFGEPMRGDWPDAPLFYIPSRPDAPPAPLQFQGEPLLFRGLVGYGAGAQLYLDGTFSRLGKGLLVVDPPGSLLQGGSSKRPKPLDARLIKGLRPPCAVVSADWHEE